MLHDYTSMYIQKTEDVFSSAVDTPLDTFKLLLDQDPAIDLLGVMFPSYISTDDCSNLDPLLSGMTDPLKVDLFDYNTFTPPCSVTYDDVHFEADSDFDRVDLLKMEHDTLFELGLTTAEGKSQDLSSFDGNGFHQELDQELHYQMLTPPTQELDDLAAPEPRPKKTRTPKYKYVKKQKPIVEYEPMLAKLLSNELVLTKILTKARKGTFKCTCCDRHFGDLFEYVSHLDENKVMRKCKCHFQDCFYNIVGFPRGAELKRHLGVLHLEYCGGGTPHLFCCDYEDCSKSFKRKDTLRRHEKLCHLNPQSRFNVNRKRRKSAST